ncbi:MAG: phosphotransferase [Anaerolineales bacterium]|nr:phosphotransferase [Anaerolineales bacterium]
MPDKRLTSFNLDQAELLGEGGESQVYALDEAHIVRIFREGASVQGVAERTKVLTEIAVGAVHLPFETPFVLEQGTLFGQIYTIEKRIPGTSLLTALATAQGSLRHNLIEQYMETAWQLGRINITRPFFGEFGRHDAIQTSTWQAYLAERARLSLGASSFANIDAGALATAVGEPSDPPAFVHLDYFAGNVMVDGDQLTAVIDFGYSSVIGDRRMNALVAAAHLVTPRITPTITTDDQAIAMAWLQERELIAYYKRGVPWLAAYWAFASDDVALYEWCRSVLM